VKRILFSALVFVGLIISQSVFALIRLEPPVRIVTAEYTDYRRLAEPDLVNLFKKYNIFICLCVREDQLNEDLDHLYTVYEKAGLHILFWPLLPRKYGLYLNQYTTDVYLEYLDVIFGWAKKTGHKIEAIVVDVEPSSKDVIKKLKKEKGRVPFEQTIKEFNQIIDKIHQNDCLAIGVGFPFVIDDRLRGKHGWEKVFGGPVASVDWDYFAVMMYTTWFVEWFKISWDTAHWMAYDYSVDLARLWGDKAAVAVGVTSPGEGQEKVVYDTPERLASAISAVRKAGIENLGVYDLKGILASGDPEAWFKVIKEAPAQLPEKGRKKAKILRKIISRSSWLFRLIVELGFF